MTESKTYRYFDTPEGQDIFKKLWVVIRPATLTGIAVSTVDVLCLPKNRSYLGIIGRYAFFTLPLVGLVSAFVITSNLAVTYRQKNDTWNWVAGALASGGVAGAWRGNMQFGSTACIAFTIVAALYKYGVDNGYEVLPRKNNHAIFASLHGPRYDFTLTEERPRNWTRGD